MKTLMKSLMFGGIFLFSQASFAWHLDIGAGSADADVPGLDKETYLKVGVGGDIIPVLSWEAGYLDLGDLEVDGLYGNVKGSIDLGGAQLFGKLGTYLWETTNDDGNDLFYGIGVGFDVGPGSLNLEYLLLDIDGTDVTLIGVSYSIGF